MTTLDATFDGSVFRPASPVALAPNTPVRLTIQPLTKASEKPTSFLRVARALKLEGPPDWASNLDKYLYGEGREVAG